MRVLVARVVIVRRRPGLQLAVQAAHFAEELHRVERLR
jgi:hypothetical protein